MTSRLLTATRRPAALGAGFLLTAALLAGCADEAAETDAAASSTEETSASTVELTTEQDDAGDVVEASYPGADGTTALDLLIEADPDAVVSGEGENGFVTGIAGHEADAAANEFWAFYINDESAQVGAGVYETTDEDVITWKLETF